MTNFNDDTPDCHIITIAEILDEHDGTLLSFMKKTGARNVIVTMQVEMSVGGGKPKKHGAALGVTYDYPDADELLTMTQQFFPKKVPYAFGWVPANLYGSDKFGIFIEQGQLGDKLANGLIDDIIQTINVEDAVTKR